MQPTLLIGLGGTGAQVVSIMIGRVKSDPQLTAEIGDSFQLMVTDTDMHVVENRHLLPEYTQNIGFFALPYLQEACRRDENLIKWFDCQILHQNIHPTVRFDLTHGAPACRQLGRLCLYRDLWLESYRGGDKVQTSIHRALSRLQQNNPDTPLIIICASLVGGTGGALALDIAYLVRQIVGSIRMNPHDCHILGVFATSEIFRAAVLPARGESFTHLILHQVAAVKEIQHYARSRYEFGPQGQVTAFDNLEPFNSYWLYGTNCTGKMIENWPNEWCKLISNELLPAVVMGDWLIAL